MCVTWRFEINIIIVVVRKLIRLFLKSIISQKWNHPTLLVSENEIKTPRICHILETCTQMVMFYLNYICIPNKNISIRWLYNKFCICLVGSFCENWFKVCSEIKYFFIEQFKIFNFVLHLFLIYKNTCRIWYIHYYYYQKFNYSGSKIFYLTILISSYIVNFRKGN